MAIILSNITKKNDLRHLTKTEEMSIAKIIKNMLNKGGLKSTIRIN